MSRYLEIKPGSISEVAKKLREDYDAYFKKELEKEKKSINQMTDAEKKAFFNRVDKGYNAKDEATSQDISPSLASKSEPKTTLVAKPGEHEKVIRIPVEKLADYKKQGWVEAESFVPEETVVEEPKNAYAIGMAAAMKATGDKPPLKKSTITKAHDIADKVKKEEVETISEEEQEKEYEAVTEKGKIKVKATNAYEASKKAAEHFGLLPQWKKMTNVVKVSPVNEVTEEIKVDKPAILKSLQDRLKKLESDPDHGGKQDMIAYVKSKIKMLQSMKEEKDPVPLTDLLKLINKEKEKLAKEKEKETKKEETIKEAGFKEIDTTNQEIKRLRVRLQQLRDAENAAAGGDTTNVEKQIHQTRKSILDLQKKQLEKQENIDSDKMNKLKEGKMPYKSYKKSLKKEETPKNLKKTMTGQPVTKIDTEPKFGNHN